MHYVQGFSSWKLGYYSSQNLYVRSHILKNKRKTYDLGFYTVDNDSDMIRAMLDHVKGALPWSRSSATGNLAYLYVHDGIYRVKKRTHGMTNTGEWWGESMLLFQSFALEAMMTMIVTKHTRSITALQFLHMLAFQWPHFPKNIPLLYRLA